ncbi:LysE family translocator [Sneathiella sp. HT1-7]|uniref:LysE family translocator n=1 Tax=Sneathiella sp. HT1-7 TaxID=2887192 RepID=UPI001D1566BB|nr:LysE family translocator [Sneathiella sp. HT1-7]MCC3305626.1 LysE family translocator [Sneathiella sp. HT1-7]
MISDLHLPLILLAAFVATASPGPAILAISGLSMNSGRRYGLAMAAGVTTGSLIWSVAAAFGLGAIMLANAWAFEVVRYFGAGYLLYLAYKSGRSAMTKGGTVSSSVSAKSYRAAYGKGLALHLTNPKAILFFGSLYSIGVPQDAPISSLAIIIGAVALQSALVFHGYALIFSSAPMVAGYARLRRWCEGAFAIVFAFAGIKILTARITGN